MRWTRETLDVLCVGGEVGFRFKDQGREEEELMSDPYPSSYGDATAGGTSLSSYDLGVNSTGKVFSRQDRRTNWLQTMWRTDKTKVLGLGFIVFMIIVLMPIFFSSNESFPNSMAKLEHDLIQSGTVHAVWSQSTKPKLRFAVVADLDRQSKKDDSTWYSIFKMGTLHEARDGSYEVTWEDEVELTTQLGEAGRGLELSELAVWQNKLWTFDDRSGAVFEIDRKFRVIPRFIIMEGNGETTKGQKSEWATVKDGKLYVGSFGKEYTNNDGTVKNRWNLWVAVIDENGKITHENWTDRYEVLRRATNAVFPGYMIHEAIEWDALNRKWWVFPRRISSDPYDEKRDEHMGSNIILKVNEEFTRVEEKKHVGPQMPLRGWSSFKFLPGSQNKLVVALKTEETEEKTTGEGTQATYITVINLETGDELLKQTLIGDHKFEGLAFI